MKIFIDSADINEIKQAYSWGIIDGITTNPSLIKKAVELELKKGKKFSLEKYIKEILKISKKTPVSLEVTGTDYDSMIKEGQILYKKFHKYGNVYIKIPVNPALCDDNTCKRNDFDGIKAVRYLSDKKIPVNCTLIFTPEQALLAAKAGAKFLSPFVGREDDFIRERAHIKFNKEDYFSKYGMKKAGKKISDRGIVSGVDLIEKCKEVIVKSGYNSEILAASIRNPRQLREVALAGADIVTLPFDVLKKSVIHRKTIEGMKSFRKDNIKEYAKVAGER